MMLVWTWIFLERDISWSWILRTISSQCHSNPVLVPPLKPPDNANYLYDGNNYDLKKRVDIWMSMDVVPVEYGNFYQKLHLTMRFFRFITGISFKWDYSMWRIIALMVWIGLWTKLRIYKVSPVPVKWYCQGFGSLWRSLMMSWIILSKNDLKVSHGNQVNDPSGVSLATSLMNFECQPCGIFECILYHQENEAIYHTIFEDYVRLVDGINKLVSSNFMGMVSSV